MSARNINCSVDVDNYFWSYLHNFFFFRATIRLGNIFAFLSGLCVDSTKCFCVVQMEQRTINLGKYNCKEACFLGMSSIACIVKLPIQLEIRCIMVMQPASQLLYNNLYWIGDTEKNIVQIAA